MHLNYNKHRYEYSSHIYINNVITKYNIPNKKLYNLKGIAMSYGCCEVDFNNERPFEEAYRKADALMYSNKEEKKMRI